MAEPDNPTAARLFNQLHILAEQLAALHTTAEITLEPPAWRMLDREIQRRTGRSLHLPGHDHPDVLQLQRSLLVRMAPLSV